MSIIETFYILFKGDATQVKKGADEAKKATDNLETSLKHSNTAANRLGSSFVNIAASLAGAAAAFVSVNTLFSGVKTAATYAKDLGDLSDKLGVSVEALDYWGAAVVKVGGSADSFSKSIEGLSKHFNISGENALRLLPRLANAFSKVSFERAKKYGGAIGIDEGTILLLQRGRRELDDIIKRQRELGVVTKQDAEIAQKFNNQWQDTERLFKSFYNTIASAILPYLIKFGKTIEEIGFYFRQHGEFVRATLLGIGAAITIVALPAILSFLATKASFLILAGIIGTVGLAFGLLYDDVKAFQRGDNSLTGEMLEKWPQVADAIKTVVEWYDKLVKLAERFGYIKENGLNLDTNLTQASRQIALASKPLLTHGLESYIYSGENTSNRSTTINTGPITVNTQATDAQAIAFGFESELKKQFKQANGGFDNAVNA